MSSWLSINYLWSYSWDSAYAGLKGRIRPKTVHEPRLPAPGLHRSHSGWSGWIQEVCHTSWKFCPCKVSHFPCQYLGLQPSNIQTRKTALQSKSMLARAKPLPLLRGEWRCSLQMEGWSTLSPNSTGWAKEPSECQYLKKFCRVLAELKTPHATTGQSNTCPGLPRCHRPSREEWALLSTHAWWCLLSHHCWPELALSKIQHEAGAMLSWQKYQCRREHF